MSKEVFNKIIAKLERLSEYLGYLKEIQTVNKKSFLNDYHFYGAAERYLQLAIEALMDVGKLIIVAQGLRKPDDSQDILNVLFEAKVVPKALHRSLQGITGFRNILVHDYEKIDRAIVHEKLKKNLDDFVEFKKVVARYLKKMI